MRSRKKAIEIAFALSNTDYFLAGSPALTSATGAVAFLCLASALTAGAGAEAAGAGAEAVLATSTGLAASAAKAETAKSAASVITIDFIFYFLYVNDLIGHVLLYARTIKLSRDYYLNS